MQELNGISHSPHNEKQLVRKEVSDASAKSRIRCIVSKRIFRYSGYFDNQFCTGDPLQKGSSDSGPICAVRHDNVKLSFAMELQAATNIEEECRKSAEPNWESMEEKQVIPKFADTINGKRLLQKRRGFLG